MDALRRYCAIGMRLRASRTILILLSTAARLYALELDSELLLHGEFDPSPVYGSPALIRAGLRLPVPVVPFPESTLVAGASVSGGGAVPLADAALASWLWAAEMELALERALERGRSGNLPRSHAGAFVRGGLYGRRIRRSGFDPVDVRRPVTTLGLELGFRDHLRVVQALRTGLTVWWDREPVLTATVGLALRWQARNDQRERDE